MAFTDNGDQTEVGLRRLFERVAGKTPEKGIDESDIAEDEMDPLLIGSLAWQRRERYRAERDKRAYSVEGAIKKAYLGLEVSKQRIRQLHSREHDSMGLQYHPSVVSIADMEAALSFVPNDRAHHKARWVYALLVGREPVVTVAGGKRFEGCKEVEPRSISEAAGWLNIPLRDAEEGYAYAEATIVTFLCNEGLIDQGPPVTSVSGITERS
jgi:hypothetical protein